ncbi:phosphopyruvate hydratase [Candidatus Thorarchaeota archaeon]|nr:MAG: phosphopyruvate hydratase [Candidatus Thorarchaeota archaeon]
MVKYKTIKAMEILDSRGNPTLMTRVVLTDESVGVARVPSGASTGANEALELRDGADRYGGKGVTEAMQNVNITISEGLKDTDPLAQDVIDEKLLELDPSDRKETLGANAILSVSMASAVAAANHLAMPLFEYLRTRVIGKEANYLQPVPMSNVINGGEHAGNELAIQEFMIMPVGAPTIREAVRCIAEVYHQLGKNMVTKYGPMAKHVGDEGGFCGFGIESTTDALDEIMGAASDAGYAPGTDIMLAMDAAASEFYKDGKYRIDKKHVDAGGLLEFYLELVDTYPIASIEDPFDETAFQDFAALAGKTDIQIVTDDLTVSNPEIVKKAIDMKAGRGLLLKVNQIGTVTEAIEAAHLANDADWPVVVSHRSGETCDTFIADLAVGLSTGQIKTGAPARSDRVAKYNRLLRIHEILDAHDGYPGAQFMTEWRNF